MTSKPEYGTDPTPLKDFEFIYWVPMSGLTLGSKNLLGYNEGVWKCKISTTLLSCFQGFSVCVYVYT